MDLDDLSKCILLGLFLHQFEGIIHSGKMSGCWDSTILQLSPSCPSHGVIASAMCLCRCFTSSREVIPPAGISWMYLNVHFNALLNWGVNWQPFPYSVAAQMSKIYHLLLVPVATGSAWKFFWRPQRGLTQCTVLLHVPRDLTAGRKHNLHSVL